MGDVLDQHLRIVRARRVASRGWSSDFPPTDIARPFAGIGFLGAYTTFSTFSVEADLLVKDGHALTAGVYVVASLVVGIAAAWVGVVGARALASR